MMATHPAATCSAPRIAPARTPSASLRDAFGRAGIDGVIRAGMNGTPGFWASENGREVGTREIHDGTAVAVSAPGYVRPGRGPR